MRAEERHLAAIDPDLDELLGVLLQTPLAFCAQAAIESIVEDAEDDPEDLEFDREFDRFRPDRNSRLGQLDLTDRIITRRIKREIRMLADIGRRAEGLGLTSVNVTPRPAACSTGSPRGWLHFVR